MNLIDKNVVDRLIQHATHINDFNVKSHDPKMMYNNSCLFYFFQFSLMFFLVKYVPITYGRDYKYPVWAEVMGWMISLSSMVSINLVIEIHERH